MKELKIRNRTRLRCYNKIIDCTIDSNLHTSVLHQIYQEIEALIRWAITDSLDEIEDENFIHST